MPQQSITVLTPRGRRQKIDVSPNMTVLEVIIWLDESTSEVL